MHIRHTADTVRSTLVAYTEGEEEIHLKWRSATSHIDENTPAELKISNVGGLRLMTLWGLPDLSIALEALGTNSEALNERWRRDYGAEHSLSELWVRRRGDVFEIRNIA